jgi:uncharacterized protein
MTLEQHIVKLVKQALPDVLSIYLFGSATTKFARTESDVDLAVLSQHKMAPLETWELSQKIAYVIRMDVDLIDLLQASTVLRMQIVGTGKRIYCKDKLACDVFETMVYSSYAFLNEERKEILEDIKQRGSVYGK